MAKLSMDIEIALIFGEQKAIDLNCKNIGTEHIIMGMIEEKGEVFKIFKYFKININSLISDIINHIQKTQSKIKNISKEETKEKPIQLELSKISKNALENSILEAKKYSKTHNNLCLLLSILKNEDDPTINILHKHNIVYDRVREKFIKYIGKSQEFIASLNEEDEEDINYKNKDMEVNKSKKRSILRNFGRDLNKLASEEKLEPVLEREKEILRVAQILGRKKKNNILLIGEPGVGKSAIAEGLAYMIVNKKISRTLYNKKVVSLDLTNLVAGTKYRGEFEQRMRELLNELQNNKNIILFIDELHTLIGAGGVTGSLDASNILKPALSRGDIQCIGATTFNEYRQYIEKDGALSRRFQNIMISPTNDQETLNILSKIKDKYESFHNVVYSQESLNSCVSLTKKYINDRYFPDKAIDVMDEAGARANLIKKNLSVPSQIKKIEEDIASIEKDMKEVKIKIAKQNYCSIDFTKGIKLQDKLKLKKALLKQKLNTWTSKLNNKKPIVYTEDIESVISSITSIPINSINNNEMKKINSLSSKIKKVVIGQDNAVNKIVKAIKRNSVGLKEDNKPIGSFIFFGSHGIGKTLLAKTLATSLFGNDEFFIRIDMSEYMERFNVSKLIGAPPGYVGYEYGGQLTEQVRKKPYCVILLDEIEKANPDVFNIMIQILDDGFVTDSIGRKVDFSNSIIIMTTNIGSKKILEFGNGIGFDINRAIAEKNINSIAFSELKKKFNPEFLNRIDDVIVFNSLSKKDITKVINIELDKLLSNLNKLNISLNITKDIMEFLITKCYNTNEGIRPLKRAIKTLIADPIVDKIVKGKIKKENAVNLEFNDNKEIVANAVLTT